MNGNINVPIALFGWIPVVLTLFLLLPPRRAVIVAFLAGWLFLPIAGYKIQGLPDYTKVTATNMGVLLAAILFDSTRVLRFRPRWLDVPMLIWCIVPFFSSITNELGPYDGLSASLRHIVYWGMPYFLGRVYFTDMAAVRELAIGICMGGLVYLPLCLWEARMSPQLHRIVYGFHPTFFGMSYRMGGWRPIVFMEHGLMLGMWMSMTALVGVWLWRTGSLRRLWGIPTGWLAAALVAMALLCRSTGAMILLALGLGILFTARSLRSGVPLLALLLIPPAWMVMRSSGNWSGNAIVDAVKSVSEERAQSLEFRLHFENQLVAKALQRPVFGWGGWGRNRVKDEETGRDMSITDGLWVIAIGINGLVGLAAITAAHLMPAFLLWLRVPARMWSMAQFAAPVALAMLVALAMVDNLMNAMLNPLFMLSAGAFGAIAPRKRVTPPTGAALVRAA